MTIYTLKAILLCFKTMIICFGVCFREFFLPQMMINYSCKSPRIKKAPEVAFMNDLLT